MNSPQPSVAADGSRIGVSDGSVDRVTIQAHAVNQGHLSLIEEIGLKSYMAVPLVLRGNTLGAIGFGSSRHGRIYGADKKRLSPKKSPEGPRSRSTTPLV